MKKIIKFTLSKISELFKFDAQYVFKGLTWLGIAQFFTSVAAFFITILLARYLSQESYGQYKYLISIIGIVGTFSLTGLITSVANASTKNFDGSLVQSFKINLKSNFLTFIIYNLIGLYYYFQGNIIFTASLFAISFSQPIIDSALLYNPYLNGKLRFKEKTIISAILSTVNIATLGLSSYLTDNIFIIILTNLSIISFANLIIFNYIKKHFCLNNLQTDETLKYGKYWSYLNVFGQLSLQVDKFLLFNFFGPTQLATYSIATGPVQQFRSLSKLIGALVLPKYSNQEYSKIKEKIFYKMFLIFIFSVFITLIYILIVEKLYVILFPNYIEAADYSKIFSLVLLIMPITLIRQYFISHERKREILITNTFIPIFKISLMLYFIQYGITGVILAYLLSELVIIILNIILFIRVKIS